MTIRIDLIRQDTSHPDKRHRHLGRARCEVADRRFETAAYSAAASSISQLRKATIWGRLPREGAAVIQ